MIVYFVRHASAGQKKISPKKDEKRPLDAEGIHQCTQTGRILSAMEVTVDAVISSPLKRATQTASLIANEIGHEGKLTIENALRPEAKYDHFRDMLGARVAIILDNGTTLAKASADASVSEGSTGHIAISPNGSGNVEEIPAKGKKDKKKKKKQLQAALTSKSRPNTSRK